jgi:hypothetical protein
MRKLKLISETLRVMVTPAVSLQATDEPVTAINPPTYTSGPSGCICQP